MNRNRSGVVVLGIGIAVMVVITVLGEFLEPTLTKHGVAGMESVYGHPGMLVVLLFALGFPLGAGLAYTGAVMFAPPPRRRVLAFAVLAIAGAVASVLIHVIFGTHNSPVYFGAGGVVLLVLIALSAWWWGSWRLRLPSDRRAAADLQGAGYVCFAMAAWNLCGVGAMPGFALYPDVLARVGSHGFAVGQMKVVMAFLVLGWLLTALSLRKLLTDERASG